MTPSHATLEAQRGRLKHCKRCRTEFYCPPSREAGSPKGEKKYCTKACADATRREVPDPERFWNKVNKGDGCWLWTASTNDDGYGHFRSAAGKHLNAHRYSYQLHNGAIPAGMTVMHSCDTPRCVNPEHLRLGTHAENMADMRSKNRGTSGEKNHKAKLTEAQVREIKSNPPKRGEFKAFAAKYGIIPSYLGRLLKGETWGHVK